jgi:hypothetical protein
METISPINYPDGCFWWNKLISIVSEESYKDKSNYRQSPAGANTEEYP